MTKTTKKFLKVYSWSGHITLWDTAAIRNISLTYSKGKGDKPPAFTLVINRIGPSMDNMFHYNLGGNYKYLDKTLNNIKSWCGEDLMENLAHYKEQEPENSFVLSRYENDFLRFNNRDF